MFMEHKPLDGLCSKRSLRPFCAAPTGLCTALGARLIVPVLQGGDTPGI